MNKYYITTPIYYVNGSPHIGHAYTNITSDVIARFMRLDGYDVKFLTGTDEHGNKIAQAAEKVNLPVQQFVDNVSSQFYNLNILLNISNDDFIRTTQKRHIKTVQYLWKVLEENGYIYLGKYSGWYDIKEETYYSKDELIDGKSPNGNVVEWVEEESYFFALSKLQNKLLEIYDNNLSFIMPQKRRNEIINFVKSGLKDLSISRISCNWGIKVPNNDKHVIYVWLDALTNYLSALGYPNSKEYKYYWPANIHIIGKEIIKFHTVYWPAFLIAAKIPLPKCVMAHGWWINEGQKMSKSLGNVLDPFELLKQFNADQIRFFMIREMPFGNDGNFTYKSLIDCVNNELSNKIGNLVQRTLSIIFNKCNTKIPNVSEEFVGNIYTNEKIIIHAYNLLPKLRILIHKQQLYTILDELLILTNIANQYITEKTPWNLNNSIKLNEVLYVLVEVIRYLAILLQPIIPTLAGKILDQINIPNNQRNFIHLNKNYAILPNTQINKPTPIFTKY